MIKTQKGFEEINAIADKVVDSIFSVHRHIGPGFNESVYEACLIEEFQLRNISYASQVIFPVVYKGKTLDKYFKVDLIAEDEIIVELKSVSEILPIHRMQLLNYLKLSGKRLGYVANFNVPLMKDGIKRMRLDANT
jgi:GxxExxY protein